MENIVFTQLSRSELVEIVQEGLSKVFQNQNQNTSDPERLIGLKEACSFLQLAPQTIYGLTSRNEIPHIKRGKKLYFSLSDLQLMLDKGKFGYPKETAL